VEAFRLYLGHLEGGGFLSVTGPAQVPPKDSLKLVATVVAALESLACRTRPAPADDPRLADRHAAGEERPRV